MTAQEQSKGLVGRMEVETEYRVGRNVERTSKMKIYFWNEAIMSKLIRAREEVYKVIIRPVQENALFQFIQLRH